MKEADHAGAKENLFHLIASLRLAEKALEETDALWRKWLGRVELAQSKGEDALAREALAEAGRQKEKRDRIAAENEALRGEIAGLKRQLPGIAARERSVDPDLLEQELRLVLGEDLAGPAPPRENTAAPDTPPERDTP